MKYTFLQDFTVQVKNASLGPQATPIDVQFKAGQTITGTSYDGGKTIITGTDGTERTKNALGAVRVTIPAAYLTSSEAGSAPASEAPAPKTASTASVATASYLPSLNVYTAGGAFLGLGLGYGMYAMAKKESVLSLFGYCFGGAALGMLIGAGSSKLVGALRGTVDTK